MIIVKKDVVCDICGAEMELAALLAAEMLKEMKGKGWRKIGLRHFCSDCLKRADERDRRWKHTLTRLNE